MTFGFLLPELRPGVRVENKFLDSLKVLSAKSKLLGEFPAGALVIYYNSIIGKGYNTTRSVNNLTGHAEINAIADVGNRIGFRKFKELDRKKLLLYTTHEPCQMCRGTINNYQFGKVYYIISKPFKYKTFYWVNFFRSYFKTLKKNTD